MTRILLLSIFVISFGSLPAMAQEVTPAAEELAEQLSTQPEADVYENDEYLQTLEELSKHPLDINQVTEEALLELRLVTEMQARQLILYREMMGKFLSLYELQAVPLWTTQLIRKLMPYLVIGTKAAQTPGLKKMIENGEKKLLLRFTQVLERAKGYDRPDSGTANFYPGGPQALLLRYEHQYKRDMQFGFLAEKDAGEQFFKGKQRQGFDFYSFHFFLRNRGIVRLLAIGDFVVNMGQGLMQWQSPGFGKGAEVMQIRKEGDLFKPYRSSGEINFHRGLALAMTKGKWQLGFFGSYRRLDANLVSDSLQVANDYVSSFQSSGYHRSFSETADKSIQRQLTLGGSLQWRSPKIELAINALAYKFGYPLQKQDGLYQQFNWQGQSLQNLGFNYAITRRNFHFFGETAISGNGGFATLQGLLLSAARDIDISLVYRSISRNYASMNSMAFTAVSVPVNEQGLYMGLVIRPSESLTLQTYADFFRFPWLKYRIDRPSEGSDYLLEMQYKPDKKLEITSRYRRQKKMLNDNPEMLALSPVTTVIQQNWRTHINYIFNTNYRIQLRTELAWFKRGGRPLEEGFLTYLEFRQKTLVKSLDFGLRLQYFVTGGYDSRIYAYENDVLYGFSVPFFDGKGLRYYANIKYKFSQKLQAWLSFSQTVYKDKTLIGSGLDEISGNRRTELKAELIYAF